MLARDDGSSRVSSHSEVVLNVDEAFLGLTIVPKVVCPEWHSGVWYQIHASRLLFDLCEVVTILRVNEPLEIAVVSETYLRWGSRFVVWLFL